MTITIIDTQTNIAPVRPVFIYPTVTSRPFILFVLFPKLQCNYPADLRSTTNVFWMRNFPLKHLFSTLPIRSSFMLVDKGFKWIQINCKLHRLLWPPFIAVKENWQQIGFKSHIPQSLSGKGFQGLFHFSNIFLTIIRIYRVFTLDCFQPVLCSRDIWLSFYIGMDGAVFFLQKG